MTEHALAPYMPGDEANGYILGADMRWYPSPAMVDIEVDRRVNAKKNAAWLWWFFLGGLNIHLAVRYPKHATLIVVLSIVLAVLTLGLSMLFWLVSWLFLLNWDDYRAQTRVAVESEMLVRRSLYG